MKIIIASSNPGKIKELQNLLPRKSFELLPQSAFNLTDVEETGLTFMENALLKARHACLETGLPAIADDSGLVVPYLQGAPGIYSARYAGKQADAGDNIQKLLADLSEASLEQRKAFFHCTMIYLAHAKDPAPLIAQGEWQGQILFEPRGREGFGYDPIFGLPDGRSSAELGLTEKNKQSHRGIAMRNLMNMLRAGV